MKRTFTPEQRKARHQENLYRLEQASKALLTSEGFQRWLDTRSKFRTYSFNNQLLIAMQSPQATMVAGFRKWQEMDRFVVKGQKAIGIFAPSVKKYEVEDEDGSVETKRVMRFRVVSVFDLSQTDGEPLPENPVTPVEGDEFGHLFDRLAEWAITEGLATEIDRVDLSNDGASGWFNPSSKEIVVDSTTSPNGQLAVLIHEVAHATGIDYEGFTREDAEVIVESVAYTVGASLGLDTSNSSVGYAALYGHADGLNAIKRYGKAIHEVATRIEAGLGLNDEGSNK